LRHGFGDAVASLIGKCPRSAQALPQSLPTWCSARIANFICPQKRPRRARSVFTAARPTGQPQGIGRKKTRKGIELDLVFQNRLSFQKNNSFLIIFSILNVPPNRVHKNNFSDPLEAARVWPLYLAQTQSKD
jgi:hypothetical protein